MKLPLSNFDLPSWLRQSGGPALVLTILYAFSGRLSFLAEVDHVLVTPIFFAPEAIALAFALRFGAGIWPGIFLGQLLLALHRDLVPSAALAISIINSLEAILAVWGYRKMGGQQGLYDLRSWITLQGMIFLLLQPFSATFGTLSLSAVGVVSDFPTWVRAWQDWWIGNAVAQSQLTPLLLLLLQREARKSWGQKVLLPLGITGSALWLSLSAFPAGSIGSTLVIFQPLLIGFGLLLGLKAVCAASVLISTTFLYATSHGTGPFFSSDAMGILDLNVFLIGVSLIAQFLAVLFRQLEEARQKEQVREKRQREEILAKLKTSLAAAGIAHEINQPLSQILLQTELTLQKLRTSPETKGDTVEALQNIRSRTEEVVETIETIRALLGNVATGQQELDLANVARSAVLYLQPTLTKKGVELHQEGLASPRTMTGDDAQLHLMVTNLLRNAVQALEKQPPGRKKISLSLTETPEAIRLTVEDTGPGFSPEQKLISELPIASTKPEGMGMGLYLVRTAVENHRGQISFGRSPTLGGAEVQVSFPK